MGKSRKINRDHPDLITNFEKDQPLIRNEVNCIICVSILVDPVTFPCKHSICLQCFNRFIRETSLNCPLCRLRLSVWSRKAIKENTLVNMKYKERLEKEFSNDTANRRREMEAMGNNSIRFNESTFENSMDCDNDDYDGPLKRDIELAKPGEIAMDLNSIYKDHQDEFDRQRRAAEEASQSLISQLVQEDPRLIQMSQVESDYKLAQELFKAEEIPVLRPRKDLLTKSKHIIPPVSKNKLKVKSVSSLTTRSISKLNTQRRHSAPTKRNSTGKSFSTSNCTTPKSGGEGAKQTRIANYFHKSPAPAPTTTPSLSGSSGSSTSVSFNFKSKSGNTPDSLHKNNKSVLSPSSAFSHLSINTPPSALPSMNLEESLHEDLKMLNSELDNSLFGSSSNQNQNGLDMINSLATVNIKPELENEDLDAFAYDTLPLSQLSSLSGEATSATGSVRSLDFGHITELYRQEEMVLKEIQNRWEQEEEDRKIALQLQESYKSGNSPRGRLAAADSNKYSIRNWMKRQPADRQP